MKVNGLVYRIQDVVYVSLIDPKLNKTTDGLPISEGVYEKLENDQVSYVDVEILDGTLDLEVDIYEFVDDYFSKYEPGDIFLKITDVMTFTFKDATIEEICDNGDFEMIADDIIEQMEEEKKEEN